MTWHGRAGGEGPGPRAADPRGGPERPADTDDELMDVVAAAFKVRLRYFGRRVKLNYLVDLKAACVPEDCFYWLAAARQRTCQYTWLASR